MFECRFGHCWCCQLLRDPIFLQDVAGKVQLVPKGAVQSPASPHRLRPHNPFFLGAQTVHFTVIISGRTISFPNYLPIAVDNMVLMRCLWGLATLPPSGPASPHDRHGWPPLAQTTRAPGLQPLAGPAAPSQGPSEGSALGVLGLALAVGGAAPDVPPPQYSASEMLVLGGSLTMCLGARLGLMLQHGVRRAVIAALAPPGVLPLSEQRVCSCVVENVCEGEKRSFSFFLSSPGPAHS